MPETITSRDTARAALGCIPADDRDLWVRMGMAVKSEFGDCDAAFQMFDAWSRTAASYRPLSTWQVWRSITPSGAVTIASLFYEAKRYGFQWTGPAPAPHTISREEHEERERRNREAEAEKVAQKAEAMAKAQHIWNAAKPAPANHPYLVMKGIRPYGIRVHHDGRLVVPIYRDGVLVSVEFIDEHGDKKYLKDSAVKGGSFVLGDLTHASTFLIGEGLATCASVHEATNLPVIVAFDAGNLKPVAVRIRAEHQNTTICIVADNDIKDGKKNDGVLAAKAAAQAIGGLVAIAPELDGKTDFNDLALALGFDFVRQTIEAVLMKERPMNTTTNESPHYTPSADAAYLHTVPSLAKEPNILAKFDKAVQACGVVGESRSAKLIYLAVTSRLLKEPVSVAVKGLSSSGKSYTTETTLKFFPAEAHISMTAMSERALVYMQGDFQHKTLVIYEAVALREQREKSESNLTAYFLRSLLSEGRIKYEVTVRDKTEGFITKSIVKEGPTNVILTTTATELHGENETRLLSIPTNDSQQQTKAVMQQLAKGGSPEFQVEDWHALQAWLQTAEHRVVIPYAAYLADNIAPVAVRLRRDFKALLRLIEAHCLLHQCTRKNDDQGRIVATPADYLAVRTLTADLIASGVGATVPVTMRETVQVVQKLATEHGVSAQAIANKLELDQSAAYRRLKAARERGYVINIEEKPRRPGRYVVGEPLPDDQDLFPLEIPEVYAQSCADGATGVHTRSPSEAKDFQAGMQVCSDSGEQYKEEVVDEN